MLPDQVCESVHPVSDHLRSVEQDRFKRCSAGVDHGGFGISDDFLCLAEENPYVRAGIFCKVWGIVFHCPCRGSGYQELPVPVFRQCCHLFRKFRQHRHHRADFPFARTCQHGNYRLVRQPVSAEKVFTAFCGGIGTVDCIHERISFIYEIHPLAFEVRNLEREDYEQHVHIFLQLADASFTGCPYFRGDVIEYLQPVPVGEFRYLEIESGVVYQNDRIRSPCEDVMLAEADIAEEF